jgi:catechol 2,3-dioxygenase-like lactoylglutathione lyase family enzyme
MFSHVHVGVADFAPSFSFYQTVLGELGLELSICRPEQSWAGWSEPSVERPLFFIGLPFDRKPVQSGNGHMTAFLALTRTTVDRCHAAALRCGGVCDGPRGRDPSTILISTVPISVIPTATRFAFAPTVRRQCRSQDCVG